MKRIMILLTSVWITACTSHETKVVYKNSTATEELGTWFDVFPKDFIASHIMDSIHSEYASMLSDIRFLDSVKGLKIDFIGMVHSDFETYSNDVALCQASLSETIEKMNYLFIGTESSAVAGKVDMDTYLTEQLENMSIAMRVLYGREVIVSQSQYKQIIEKWVPYDFVLQKLFSHNEKPYLVGTEPRWVWYAEQFFRNIAILPDISPEDADNIRKLIPILNRCRSEIAFARTARQLLKDDKNSTAVLLYGKNHLDHFKQLAQEFGTKSRFILTKECDKATVD